MGQFEAANFAIYVKMAKFEGFQISIILKHSIMESSSDLSPEIMREAPPIAAEVEVSGMLDLTDLTSPELCAKPNV